MVSHHSTDLAVRSLTLEIGRDPVLSPAYGRSWSTSYFCPISVIFVCFGCVDLCIVVVEWELEWEFRSGKWKWEIHCVVVSLIIDGLGASLRWWVRFLILVHAWLNLWDSRLFHSPSYSYYLNTWNFIGFFRYLVFIEFNHRSLPCTSYTTFCFRPFFVYLILSGLQSTQKHQHDWFT